MRFRYRFENGKHLVKTRDDAGNWKETKEYKTREEAEAVAQKGEAGGLKIIAEAEKGKKGEVRPSDLPGETVTSGTVDNPKDKGKAMDDPAPVKPWARPSAKK